MVRRARAMGVLVVHGDSQVSPEFARAMQRVLEAEMITDPVPSADRDHGEDMGR